MFWAGVPECQCHSWWECFVMSSEITHLFVSSPSKRLSGFCYWPCSLLYFWDLPSLPSFESGLKDGCLKQVSMTCISFLCSIGLWKCFISFLMWLLYRILLVSFRFTFIQKECDFCLPSGCLDTLATLSRHRFPLVSHPGIDLSLSSVSVPSLCLLETHLAFCTPCHTPFLLLWSLWSLFSCTAPSVDIGPFKVFVSSCFLFVYLDNGLLFGLPHPSLVVWNSMCLLLSPIPLLVISSCALAWITLPQLHCLHPAKLKPCARWTTSPILHHLTSPENFCLLFVSIYLTSACIIVVKPQRYKILLDFSFFLSSLLFSLMAIYSGSFFSLKG